MKILSKNLFDCFKSRRKYQTSSNDGLLTLLEVYSTQDELITLLNDSPGAWKVGTGDHEHDIFASIIPSKWLYNSPTTLRLNSFSLIGIELEYAFKLKNIKNVTHQSTDENFENIISEVAASVEIVTTRIEGWPNVPTYLKIADFQSNGALIIGESIAYSPNLNFINPKISLQINGTEQTQLIGKNPAGDPRLLLPKLVIQQLDYGRNISPDHWITTGSLSGIVFVEHPTSITGTITGLPSVNLTLK